MKNQTTWVIVVLSLVSVVLALETWTLQAENSKLRQKLDAIVQGIPPRSSDKPEPEMELGIIDSREAFPNITTGMNVENRWQGLAENGGLMIVFAGSETADTDQGLVMYVKLRPDSAVPEEVLRFPTPTREGPVKVVVEKEKVLTLKAKSGNRYVFATRELDLQIE